MKYAALLRGVNVGGKNLVPMKALAALFTDTGCRNVTTYIQSGNVIFTADAAVAGRLPATIFRRIAEQFGFSVPVILRSGPQLETIVSNNPYCGKGLPESALHVGFLAERPDDAAVQSLDRARSLPDSFEVSGSEIYLYLPNGAGKTKLTNAWFDSKLKTVSTLRNWATVLRLRELLQTR